MSNVGVCISVIFLLKREVDATQTQTTPNRPLAPIIPLCLCDTGSNTCRTVASITWQDDWWANLLREEEIKTERLRRSESWVTESQSGKKNSGLSLRCSPYKVQRDTHTLQLLCVIVSFFISLRLAVGTASSNAKFPPSFESLLSLVWVPPLPHPPIHSSTHTAGLCWWYIPLSTDLYFPCGLHCLCQNTAQFSR